MIQTLLILLFARGARAGTEVIDGFRFRACAHETCVSIESARAWRSPLDPSYVFRGARVAMFVNGTRTRVFDGTSGYYEPTLGYLVMHGRGLIDLASGRVTLIK